MNKINNFLFEKEYQFRCVIEKISEDTTITSFITSRIVALSLSVFALLNTVNDLCYITYHTFAALGHSVMHLESPLKYCTTTRSIAVVAVEFFRHLSGVFLGSLIGIVSPTHAAKWMLPSNQKPMEIRKENITEQEAQRLYEMTGIVHDVFVQNNIEYCMTGGTQLGAARHEGIIPWDDDVDLFVLKAAQENIRNLKVDLEENGIGMIECHLGFKFFDLKGKEVKENFSGNEYVYRYPFIDICVADTDERGHITYINEHFKNHYAGEYLTEDEWNARSLQKFGNLSLYGAPDPEKFCKRMYGENVFNYGYQLLNHRSFKLEIPRKYYLEKEDNGKCKSIDEVYQNSR